MAVLGRENFGTSMNDSGRRERFDVDAAEDSRTRGNDAVAVAAVVAVDNVEDPVGEFDAAVVAVVVVVVVSAGFDYEVGCYGGYCCC